MEEEDRGFEFTTLEDVRQFLKDNYPDKMVLKEISEFDRLTLIGAQLLANNLLARLGD